MDFGLDGVALQIATSTSAYLIEFAPVIILIAGLALAFGIIERLIDIFKGTDKINNDENN